MGEVTSDLYLYLPSADKSVSENKISDFTIRLPTPIRLSSSIRFEAALTKCIYPPNINNITDGEIKFYSYVQKTMILTRIPAGFYPNPTYFIKAYIEALGNDAKTYALDYDPTSRKFKLYCKLKNPYLEISDNLQSLTGLPHLIEKEGVT
jgi:hypothetical protein